MLKSTHLKQQKPPGGIDSSKATEDGKKKKRGRGMKQRNVEMEREDRKQKCSQPSAVFLQTHIHTEPYSRSEACDLKAFGKFLRIVRSLCKAKQTNGFFTQELRGIFNTFLHTKSSANVFYRREIISQDELREGVSRPRSTNPLKTVQNNSDQIGLSRDLITGLEWDAKQQTFSAASGGSPAPARRLIDRACVLSARLYA
ncbi:uncharacterized protein V6R79_008344 [Siganus canaliculatus]